MQAEAALQIAQRQVQEARVDRHGLGQDAVVLVQDVLERIEVRLESAPAAAARALAVRDGIVDGFILVPSLPTPARRRHRVSRSSCTSSLSRLTKRPLDPVQGTVASTSAYDSHHTTSGARSAPAAGEGAAASALLPARSRGARHGRMPSLFARDLFARADATRASRTDRARAARRAHRCDPRPLWLPLLLARRRLAVARLLVAATSRRPCAPKSVVSRSSIWRPGHWRCAVAAASSATAGSTPMERRQARSHTSSSPAPVPPVVDTHHRRRGSGSTTCASRLKKDMSYAPQ